MKVQFKDIPAAAEACKCLAAFGACIVLQLIQPWDMIAFIHDGQLCQLGSHLARFPTGACD